MTDQPGDDRGASERIEAGGIAGALSLAALRSLLDPETQGAATIDLDLSQLRVTIPASAVHEVIARLLPDGDLVLRDGGITARPGGGAPGVNISVPTGGLRLRVQGSGLTIGSD